MWKMAPFPRMTVSDLTLFFFHSLLGMASSRPGLPGEVAMGVSVSIFRQLRSSRTGPPFLLLACSCASLLLTVKKTIVGFFSPPPLRDEC